MASGGPEEYEKLCFAATSAAISEQSRWMIISIAIGVWAQRDLWDDVETALLGISIPPLQDPAVSADPPLNLYDDLVIDCSYDAQLVAPVDNTPSVLP